MVRILIIALVTGLALVITGCSQGSGRIAELKHFPLDNVAEVPTASGGELDLAVSSDGNGSLRFDAESPRVIPLFEVADISIEDALLIYQAHLRTRDIRGQVYLEMWCSFPGKGEFFSRGLRSPLTGNSEWTTASTPFILKKGEMPERVRLNLVIDGAGTAWIDDVRLLRSTTS
jgi:hypothetical protein